MAQPESNPAQKSVFLDPGLRHCGVACFTGRELKWAGLVRNPVKQERGVRAWLGMARAVQAGLPPAFLESLDVFVTELMQVDGRRGRVDDLFQLYGVAMWVGHSLASGEIHGYYPRQWKGSVPKEVMGPRIEGRLTPQERLAVSPCAPSLRHNIVDAIGIGLFHFKRL